jgi:hypothetical protein
MVPIIGSCWRRVLVLQVVQEMISRSQNTVQSVEQDGESAAKRMELIDRAQPRLCWNPSWDDRSWGQVTCVTICLGLLCDHFVQLCAHLTSLLINSLQTFFYLLLCIWHSVSCNLAAWNCLLLSLKYQHSHLRTTNYRHHNPIISLISKL